MRFFFTERIIVTILFIIMGADVVLFLMRQPAVDWQGYGGFILFGFFILSLGFLYRVTNRDENIAQSLIATGLFMFFSMAVSFFNYLLLPVGGRRIDLFLIQLDAYLGYSWPDYVSWLSTMPAIGKTLGYFYLSCIPQFVVLIVTLGLTGRTKALHRFLLTGMIGVLGSILFWFVFPSSGPSAYYVIPDDVVSRLSMVVGPEYGAELNRLAIYGPTLISPNDILGLVAFPSFHMVMALMGIFLSRPLPYLFPFFFVLNILMIPGILGHGGHHLVDLFAGVILFCFALRLADYLLTKANEV